MRNLLTTTFGALAILAALAGTAGASVLNFAMNASGLVPLNNEDLTVTYGSNVTAANIIGAVDGGEGFTPNIALTWAPTGGLENAFDPLGDILELHSAATFTGANLTVPVLQLDVDASNHSEIPEHPTLDFVPEAGWAVRIHEFQYGNATDQGGQAPHPWTFSILALPGLTPTGSSVTTADLGAGDNGIATFNFTGTPGVSYRLLFDDGDLGCTSFDCHNPRTGIDNIRFSQVAAATGVDGDYNGDLVVNAADYTLWRDNLGAPTEASLNNNGDGGGVTADDYTFWKTRFGNISGSGSGLGSSAVPEPSTLGLIGVLLIGLAAGSLRSVQGRYSRPGERS